MAPVTEEKQGSESFTDTSKNRNSLTVVPSRQPDASCLHKGVRGEIASGGFSAERGHPVFPIKAPTKAVSCSIGEIAQGDKTSNHRHAYEALMYVISGKGYSIVEGKRFDWEAGDSLYTPPWCWHQHFALEGHAVQYITATNMPMLHALGQTVIREEESPEHPHLSAGAAGKSKPGA
ncbi:cupin domain-containing protein [Stigmatella aurantiaca]|nr:cupin domain-containing protein [Stigmatella aurantiaca]ADO71012.1 Cupin domain protein [Stigmatella aurantiaca DW4/3-1]